MASGYRIGQLGSREPGAGTKDVGFRGAFQVHLPGRPSGHTRAHRTFRAHENVLISLKFRKKKTKF